MIHRTRLDELGESARKSLAERRHQERILKGVFERTLGRRAFALISAIGIREEERDDFEVTTYAKDLGFQLADQDTAHVLRFSASRGRWLTSHPGRILSVSAVLRAEGDDDSPVAIDIRHVTPDVFVHGTSVPGNSRWLGREAVPKYKASIDGFTSLLEVGEGLVAGQDVETMLDKLPFLVSGDTVPINLDTQWKNPPTAQRSIDGSQL